MSPFKSTNLSDYGILYVAGTVDENTAAGLCRDILLMNLEGKHDLIQMIVSSAGGSLDAAFAVLDVMEWSRIPIHTVGLGVVASAGLALFMAGRRGHRVLTPRTSVLSHPYSTAFQGNYGQAQAHRKQQDCQYAKLVDLYLRHTNARSREELEAGLLRDTDTWLTPEEAVACGLADQVAGFEPPRPLGS